MSGTHVFYNGVELRDCVTKQFDQQIVDDEAGNGLLSKFTITVESLVFGFFNSASSTPGSYEDLVSHPSTVVTKLTEEDNRQTATDRMGIIQRLLKEPRKDFWYATHGGKREDVAGDNIYQIMLAATGADEAGTADVPKFFKNIFGQDLQLKYLKGFNATGTTKIPRHNVVDVNNGPTPRDVRLTEIYGGRAFRLSFTIEVSRHLCLTQDPAIDEGGEIIPTSLPFNLTANEKAQASPYVLSNTWSTEETCDENFIRTRSVSGTLRIRDNRYWSQMFRYLCIPGLLPGYRRVSQRFASDPTNLVLKYSIQDRQAEAAPPAPAIDWDMRHVDSSKNEYGMVERQLSIKLVGLPKTPKQFLLAGAIRVLDMRFPGSRVHVDGGAKVDFRLIRPVPFSVTGMTIIQSANKPEVEIMANIRQHIAGVGGFEQATEASSQPLSFAGYDPDNWPAPRPFDANRPAGIFACYAQRPCSQWHGIPQQQYLPAPFEVPAVDAEADDPSRKWNSVQEIADGLTDNYWEESGYQEYEDSDLMGVLDADEIVSNVHRTDYLNYPAQLLEIDTRYENNTGLMHLPLSAPRTIPFGGGGVTRVQSAIAAPVHAPMMTRKITVVGVRHGAPVEFPEPALTLQDENGVIETLVDTSVIVLDAPQSDQGQQYRVFSAQMSLIYLLDRPLTTTERYRMGNSPNLGTTPLDNSISGLAMFGRGRIEMHQAPATSPGGTVPQTVAPTINNTTVGYPLD